VEFPQSFGLCQRIGISPILVCPFGVVHHMSEQMIHFLDKRKRVCTRPGREEEGEGELNKELTLR
jgi:hypothetical protein